jgi:signal peptidase I
MPRQKSLFRIIAEPLAIAVLMAVCVRAVARICAVPSASMAPVLRPGDHIVVTRYLSDEPARGDVIVFHHPDGSGLTVKRVIALPGDLVDAEAGRVRLSGKLIHEPYAAGNAGSISPQLVPTAHLFVMGDNRGDSRDSRHWGPLPARLVVGRARMVLWSQRHDRTERRIFKWIE